MNSWITKYELIILEIPKRGMESGSAIIQTVYGV